MMGRGEDFASSVQAVSEIMINYLNMKYQLVIDEKISYLFSLIIFNEELRIILKKNSIN